MREDGGPGEEEREIGQEMKALSEINSPALERGVIVIDGARGRDEEAGHDLEQGAFSRAVHADDGDDLAWREVEMDVTQGPLAAKDLGDVCQLDFHGEAREDGRLMRGWKTENKSDQKDVRGVWEKEVEDEVREELAGAQILP